MKTKTLIVIAIVLMAVVQIACAASANVGSPTPQPAPTASPPQVIVVDRPVPTPTESHDNSLLVPALIGVMFGTVMAAGVSIGYIARGQKQQPASPAAEPTQLTLTTHNYYNIQPQLSNFEQYQLLKQRGFSPQIAQQIIAEGRANQFLLPPGQ